MDFCREMKRLDLSWGVIGRYLRHMTGSEKVKSQGYRNYFTTTPDSAVDKEMAFMVNLGLVYLSFNSPKQRLYRATREGCELIGMTKIGIKKAMGEAD